MLRLEAKHAGTAQQAINIFGKEGLETLARKEIPKEDYYKLLAYGKKADSRETARQLLERYASEGAKFLERLPAKQILAYGLSAAMITVAWNVSDGVGDAVRSSPETMPQTAGEIVGKLQPVLMPIGIAVALVVLFITWKWAGRRPAERET